MELTAQQVANENVPRSRIPEKYRRGDAIRNFPLHHRTDTGRRLDANKPVLPAIASAIFRGESHAWMRANAQRTSLVANS